MTTIEITPPTVALALTALADCVCTELADRGAGPTCWCGIYPGAAVSFEFCGECAGGRCGMGWVRLAGAFPYDTFPNPTLDARCVRPVAWGVEIGALRCLPIPPDGQIPEPEVVGAVAVDQILDANALLAAIQCCGLPGYAIQNWVPLGPDGGCVGGSWTIFVEG